MNPPSTDEPPVVVCPSTDVTNSSISPTPDSRLMLKLAALIATSTASPPSERAMSGNRFARIVATPVPLQKTRANTPAAATIAEMCGRMIPAMSSPIDDGHQRAEAPLGEDPGQPVGGDAQPEDDHRLLADARRPVDDGGHEEDGDGVQLVAAGHGGVAEGHVAEDLPDEGQRGEHVEAAQEVGGVGDVHQADQPLHGLGAGGHRGQVECAPQVHVLVTELVVADGVARALVEVDQHPPTHRRGDQLGGEAGHDHGGEPLLVLFGGHPDGDEPDDDRRHHRHPERRDVLVGIGDGDAVGDHQRQPAEHGDEGEHQRAPPTMCRLTGCVRMVIGLTAAPGRSTPGPTRPAT